MELEIVDIKNIQWLGAGTWEMSANMTNTFQNEMKKGLAILFSKVTEQIGTPLLWGTATSTDAFLSPNLCGTASWDEGAGSTPHLLTAQWKYWHIKGTAAPQFQAAQL